VTVVPLNPMTVCASHTCRCCLCRLFPFPYSLTFANYLYIAVYFHRHRFVPRYCTHLHDIMQCHCTHSASCRRLQRLDLLPGQHLLRQLAQVHNIDICVAAPHAVLGPTRRSDQEESEKWSE